MGAGGKSAQDMTVRRTRLVGAMEAHRAAGDAADIVANQAGAGSGGIQQARLG